MYIKVKPCILDFLLQLTVTKSVQPHKQEVFQNAGQAGRQAHVHFLLVLATV